MSPEKYKRVKDIFLAACEKPLEGRARYVETAAGEDAEIRREVESLLREHSRETQVIPENPESPIGSMSAILSRANIDLGNTNERAGAAAEEAGRSNDPHRADEGEASAFLDDSNPSSGSNSGFVDAGRFMAGTVAAGRYRIIELLGRGGMGEVYRADDITLNQAVALKFLPALFGQDQTWQDRFHNEVRLARQVTHPNVCRVFDIGEFQGEQFISMEYVDGENLASLLRRIGRLPNDKGLQIARQLCAGLAAAHDRGVLHRDLKPANVMIDGRGSVRITDFGLAAPADQLRKDALRAGTPAYMSPEQLAGRGVSVRSDIYSLGLILYEMFTGKRAFRGDSVRDYQKLHSSEHPTPPSEIVRDIDPIVERVILRCLEKDPKDRPANAIAVSAALPGGNPLREILAAGETPSPEVIAAAGEAHGGLKPRTAAFFLAAGLVSLVIVGILAPWTFLVQRAIRENPPVVLTHQARDILKTLGYADKPVDEASGFAVNADYYTAQPKGVEMAERPWKGLVSFWYRQSPETLIPWNPDTPVAENDPPAEVPGMLRVSLAPYSGRLTGLEVEPTTTTGTAAKQGGKAAASQGGPTVDWRPLLIAAKMEGGEEQEGNGGGYFHAVTPSQTPPVFVEQRAAWEGSFQGSSEKVHVEAGMCGGKPVFFTITGAEKTLSDDKTEILNLGNFNLVVQTLVNLLLIVAGGFLAVRNYRSGRGDRGGAMRLALLFFILGAIAWLFRTHHVADLVMEFRLFTSAMGSVIYTAALVWIYYLALEPYVRRIWPETVISWSRVLAGRWIDPIVGRDVLIGAVVGIFATLLNMLDRWAPPWLGLPPLPPNIHSSMQMLESATNYSTLFSGTISSIYVGLLLLLFLVVMRLALRRKALAAVAFVAIFVGATAQWGSHDYISWIVQGIMGMLFLGLLVRHGLVAIVFCFITRMLLTDFPVTFDFSLWYRASAICGIGATVAILVVAAYAAMGGKPLVTLRFSER